MSGFSTSTLPVQERVQNRKKTERVKEHVRARDRKT